MINEFVWWALVGLLTTLAVIGPALKRRRPLAWWYAIGFPVAVVRMLATWKRVAAECDLAVSRRPPRALLGELVVKGDPLRPHPPRLGLPVPTRTGLQVRIRLHPGQTPAKYLVAAEALAHAWRMHAVRVTSPERGLVKITATAADPLAGDGGPSSVPRKAPPPALLRALVGAAEDGGAWVMDLMRVPHWLIVGATQSGKSNLVACLVAQLAPQPVALVGIDCKGGMELSVFAKRLSVLACDRREAAAVLAGLVVELNQRMFTCRTSGVRSIWELSAHLRPVPIVVIVDEVAELYLSAGRTDKAVGAEISANLLRTAQLGAALGIHLVIAGQRVGSDLGPGVTALRAQLGGRVCHAVHDKETAVMALGDLAPDALAVAQAIGDGEQGVAVTTAGGGWTRVRSILTPAEVSRSTAHGFRDRVPPLPVLADALRALDAGEE